MGITRISHCTVLVRDQQEALDFYTQKFGFTVHEDAEYGPGFRWVTVTPPEQPDLEVTLHKPMAGMMGEEAVAEQMAMIGKQPMFLLSCDDCRQTVEDLRAKGVTIVREVEEQPYGVEAIIADLYGNTIVMTSPPLEK